MYKDLEVWKESIELIKAIYGIADKLPKSEEYNLKSQIRRAVVSVALNIAEGKTRQSAKDCAHFLNISVASLNEVEACLSICEELNFIDNNQEIHEKCKILCRRINALKAKIYPKEVKYDD